MYQLITCARHNQAFDRIRRNPNPNTIRKIAYHVWMRHRVKIEDCLIVGLHIAKGNCTFDDIDSALTARANGHGE